MQALDGLQYDIGQPMTEEQMIAFRRAEQGLEPEDYSNTECSAPSETLERNPMLVEDTPIGNRRFVALSVLAPNGTQQKHSDGNMYIKIKTTVDRVQDASLLLSRIPCDNCDVFIYEMFKFCVVPPPCTTKQDEVDDAMNDALEEYTRCRKVDSDAFHVRKQTMMEDIKRQENIKQRVRDGELDETAIESESVLPEVMKDAGEQRDSIESTQSADAVLQSDTPTAAERFAVLCTVDVSDLDLPSILPTNAMIIKVCGVFVRDEDADHHAAKLRKSFKNKYYDICVVSMYEWLRMPPPVDTIENVVYHESKLTDAIGTRKHEIDADELANAEPTTV
jgi:hypothetical protein